MHSAPAPLVITRFLIHHSGQLQRQAYPAILPVNVWCLKALTGLTETHIVDLDMSSDEQIGKDMQQLELRVDDLIGVCRRLKDENDSLRDRQDTLIEEKTKLAEKNRMARTRLENIVTRLKALDKHQ